MPRGPLRFEPARTGLPAPNNPEYAFKSLPSYAGRWEREAAERDQFVRKHDLEAEKDEKGDPKWPKSSENFIEHAVFVMTDSGEFRPKIKSKGEVASKGLEVEALQYPYVQCPYVPCRIEQLAFVGAGARQEGEWVQCHVEGTLGIEPLLVTCAVPSSTLIIDVVAPGQVAPPPNGSYVVQRVTGMFVGDPVCCRQNARFPSRAPLMYPRLCSAHQQVFILPAKDAGQLQNDVARAVKEEADAVHRQKKAEIKQRESESVDEDALEKTRLAKIAQHKSAGDRQTAEDKLASAEFEFSNPPRWSCKTKVLRDQDDGEMKDLLQEQSGRDLNARDPPSDLHIRPAFKYQPDSFDGFKDAKDAKKQADNEELDDFSVHAEKHKMFYGDLEKPDEVLDMQVSRFP